MKRLAPRILASGMDKDNPLPDVFDGSDSLLGVLESMEEERMRLLSQLEDVFSPRRSAADFALEFPPSRKRTRTGENAAVGEGEARMSHISVERNRRKQMNEHLSELKSLMPCFYVKRVMAASSCLLPFFPDRLLRPCFFTFCIFLRFFMFSIVFSVNRSLIRTPLFIFFLYSIRGFPSSPEHAVVPTNLSLSLSLSLSPACSNREIK